MQMYSKRAKSRKISTVTSMCLKKFSKGLNKSYEVSQGSSGTRGIQRTSNHGHTTRRTKKTHVPALKIAKSGFEGGFDMRISYLMLEIFISTGFLRGLVISKNYFFNFYRVFTGFGMKMYKISHFEKHDSTVVFFKVRENSNFGQKVAKLARPPPVKSLKNIL